jgi:hypothetical protein
MVVIGTVRNGMVVLEGEGAGIPEGTRVKVEPIAQAEGGYSLYDTLAPVVGQVTDLPPDAAENIDRDLYGADE